MTKEDPFHSLAAALEDPKFRQDFTQLHTFNLCLLKCPVLILIASRRKFQSGTNDFKKPAHNPLIF